MVILMDLELRLNCSKTRRLEGRSEVSLDDNYNSFKKKRGSSSSINSEENGNRMTLIPNLPDDISLHIIARVPRIFYMELRLVSLSWKCAIMSSELFSMRKMLGTTEEWLYILTNMNYEHQICYCLDPLSSKWQRVPLIVGMVDSDPSSGLGEKGLLGDDTRIPAYGSTILSVDGCLYLFGGFCRDGSAVLKCVWRYDPVQNRWSEVSPMQIGRAHCSAGLLNNKIYVVGGLTTCGCWYRVIPLQSGEVFDPITGVWSQIPSMPFQEATQEGSPSCAKGMASYKGKLYVPLIRDGEVYDPETNSWSQMATGMSLDWPSSTPGMNPSVIINDELYGLDLYNSDTNRYNSNTATIKVYDQHFDIWRVTFLVPDFPPYVKKKDYLLAAFLGKLHVISEDYDNHKYTVLQLDMKKDQLHPPSMLPPSKKISSEEIDLEPESENFSQERDSESESGNSSEDCGAELESGSGHSCEESDSESESGNSYEGIDPVSETGVWKVIATRSSVVLDGLDGCQVLDI